MTRLTLSTNPASLQWLVDCPRLAGQAASGKLASETRTVRYDTPDLRLYRRGIALEVRQEGGRFVQKLCTSEPKDETAAQAWESEIAGPEPALDRLPATGRTPLLANLPENELAPVMTWRVSRHTRVLQEPAEGGVPDIIEVAFDEGEIETAGAAIPIAEIELSVLRGESDAPQRLALELQKSVPLNLDPRSRFERGLQYIADVPPRWHKAPRPACVAGSTVDEALTMLFSASLSHLLANEGAALDGRDPEGVHQMRVALRRMRAAWSAFGRIVDDETSRQLRGDAKWLASSLGPARDWDVFLGDQLVGIEARHPSSPALATLRAQAETTRTAAYHQARAALLSQRTTRFVLELGRWVAAHGWREGVSRLDRGGADDPFARPLPAFAAASLERQYRKIRKRGKGFARLPAEARHDLRIRIKKIRYTAEFFVLLFDEKKARRFAANAAALQDALGTMNDVAMLDARLDKLHAAAPENTELARGIGLVIGDARADAARTGEAEVRAAWQRFKRSPTCWRSALA